MTSHGNKKPSMVPLDNASATAGTGMPTGVAPSLANNLLVKRVGAVHGAGRDAMFQACSDNPGAPGVVDSRDFGLVGAAGTYRVIWTVRR